MNLPLQLLSFSGFFAISEENTFPKTRCETESVINKHKTTTVSQGNHFVLII